MPDVFRRVERIVIRNLFGFYTHKIYFHLVERVTVIHGPNGVGKTALLRLVDSFFAGRYSKLLDVPYSELEIGFDDSSRITILPILPDATDESKLPNSLMISHFGPSDVEQKFEYQARQLDSRLARRIALEMPNLNRVGANRWFDERSNRTLTGGDVIRSYGEQVPYGMAHSEEPDWLEALRNSVEVHLIETQRLLTFPRQRPRMATVSVGFDGRPVSTVKTYAAELARNVSSTLTSYANRSQALDQSFPTRMLSDSMSLLPVNALIEKMRYLLDKRDTLSAVGLLSEDQEDSAFNLDRLNRLTEAQTAVMTLYVNDTEEKLQALDDLSNRVSLLFAIINKKFRHKKLGLHDGLLIITEESGRRLDLDTLSSGEQHELILVYNLLFKVKPNSLVMIDEPELSLHVNWQRAFLPDLLSIIDANPFDVMLATHSPQIVGSHTKLMVELSSD